VGITRTFYGTFVAFDAGVVSGNPHDLDVAPGENLHGLEKFAGAGDGNFLKADASLLIYFAGDGDFFCGVGFSGIVHGAHRAQARYELLHQVEMMFHLGKAANAREKRQMLGSAAACACGDRVADASKNDGLVFDLVAGAGEAGRGDSQDEINIRVVVVLKDGRNVDDFALRIRADQFQILTNRDAALLKPIEHAIHAEICANAGRNRDNGGFERAIGGGQRTRICRRSQRGVSMSEVGKKQDRREKRNQGNSQAQFFSGGPKTYCSK